MKAYIIISILCIFTLAMVALLKGVNGAVLSSSLALIGGLGGFGMGKVRRS